MKRLGVLLLVLTVTASARQNAGVGAVSEDVRVPAGIDAVARELGLTTVPDRARFVSETTRLVFNSLDRKNDAPDVLRQKLRQMTIQGRSTDLVPVPLTTAIWSAAIFHRLIAPSDLLATILGDRRAALLCHGLASVDTDTLRYLADHPQLLEEIYRSSSAAFGAFAGSLRIRGDRVVLPGGDAARDLWEQAVGEPANAPDRFVAALFTRDGGRLAYLYDSIGQLDAPRRSFALGLWIADSAARVGAMRALTKAWNDSLSEWRLDLQPFTRSVYDAASLLMRVRVQANGAPAPPTSRRLWSAAFEGTAGDGPLSAAWLIDTMAFGSSQERADRLDTLAFGQRVFGSAGADETADVLAALRAFPRYRMLLLTLDRMQIRTPSVYGAAVRAAVRLSALDPGRAAVPLAQFQGALTLVAHMANVHTISETAAEALVSRLVALPLADDRFDGAIVRWLEDRLRTTIGRADTLEAAMLAALSGPRPLVSAARIEWEGQAYRLDLADAERRRLERVRERQGGPPIDLALDLMHAAEALSAPSLTAAEVVATTSRLQGMAREYADERLAGAIDELTKSGRAGDLRRASRVSETLTVLADDVAARVLMSLAYAVYIGEPDGAALLLGDISVRHDFGLRIVKDDERRLRTPWALPTRDLRPNVPWHVTGSLLGLDVALAPLALRRVSTDRVPPAPTLTTTARDGFARNVALLNPFALDNRVRDAMVEALVRGERRVAALVSRPTDLDSLADELEMNGGRRRAIAWTIVEEPARVNAMFSLGEMLRLGRPAADLDLAPWGTAAVASSGCLCTEMPLASWTLVAGRPQIAVMAEAIGDLNLHVARVLKDLGLPAPLTKYVAGAAAQDFMDEVRPTDADDWLTLSRAIGLLSRERIEDYVAAVTADGPLVPEENRGRAALQNPAAPVRPGGARLTILAPEAGSYVSGLTTLRARMTPPDAASGMTFFVDGRQVCAVTSQPYECEWNAGRAVVEHQIRAVATLSAGGRFATTIRTEGIGQADNVDVDVVQLAVTVPDGRGGFVRGLPASAFHVSEDGRPQKLSHFASENVPIDLVVAVDTSASMAKAMPTLKTSVQGFLGAVPSGNQVTLVAFNDTIFTLARRAANPADRVKAVERLAPWGTTALYDVILRGIEMLGHDTGRKALVVFTDGEDEGSFATLADVERGVQSSDVTLYLIGQGTGAAFVARQKLMEQISAPTGGRALVTDNIDQLRDAFSALLNELSNQYFLSYPPPSAARDGQWRTITVNVDGQADVRARKGYRNAAER